MQISRPQIIDLRDALDNALGIVQMDDVVTRLGQDRANITMPSNKKEMFREIVDFFNRQNRVHELIIISRTYNDRNPMLDDFARQVGLEGAFLPVATNAGLEKVVNDYLPILNADAFVKNAALTKRRVCLVSNPSDTNLKRPELGTGFLVGPGAVLTNYHVVLNYIRQPALATGLRFTFDFNEKGQGKVYEPQLSPGWLIHDSPYVTDDDGGSAPYDTPADRLDYAVLRVAGRPGDETAGDGTPRGWFVLPTEAYNFAARRALLLYHHADGRPLELSIDTDSYREQNASGTRIWHRSNTEGGSSGSPCFDLEWNPVALHQGSNRLRGETTNRAAPLDAVRRLLEERGKLGELEA